MRAILIVRNRAIANTHMAPNAGHWNGKRYSQFFQISVVREIISPEISVFTEIKQVISA